MKKTKSKAKWTNLPKDILYRKKRQDDLNDDNYILIVDLRSFPAIKSWLESNQDGKVRTFHLADGHYFKGGVSRGP